MSSSSQKFIARNRAPRVQIEYEVETYGADKKVELPFVMGVLADLRGTPDPENKPPKVTERSFLPIDAENFDARMAALRPMAAFQVKNHLTGEGQEETTLPVKLTFNCMDDFRPGAIAQRLDGVKELLAARQKLANLATWLDGRSDAEELIADSLQDLDKFKDLVSTLSKRGGGENQP